MSSEETDSPTTPQLIKERAAEQVRQAIANLPNDASAFMEELADLYAAFRDSELSTLKENRAVIFYTINPVVPTPQRRTIGTLFRKQPVEDQPLLEHAGWCACRGSIEGQLRQVLLDIDTGVPYMTAVGGGSVERDGVSYYQEPSFELTLERLVAGSTPSTLESLKIDLGFAVALEEARKVLRTKSRGNQTVEN